MQKAKFTVLHALRCIRRIVYALERKEGKPLSTWFPGFLSKRQLKRPAEVLTHVNLSGPYNTSPLSPPLSVTIRDRPLEKLRGGGGVEPLDDLPSYNYPLCSSHILWFSYIHNFMNFFVNISIVWICLRHCMNVRVNWHAWIFFTTRIFFCTSPCKISK